MWWRRRWAVDPFLEPQRWPSQRAARCLKLRWNAITSSNGYGNSFQAVMKGMTNTERASAQLFIFFPSLLKLPSPGHHGVRLFCHPSISLFPSLPPDFCVSHHPPNTVFLLLCFLLSLSWPSTTILPSLLLIVVQAEFNA